ncbi:Adenosylmethionine-8-amino-7-oxononanoate aminotransferase [Termitomyces sp. T112]|nr:Adenosylmethionine-8-amino-7-oxononanoate aminotransferase [Termitomyces sp. T112]
MSLLFRHLRAHHVFGANTDVGKTVLTTALVRASARTHPVYYLKPVSTGPLAAADTAHVRRHAPSAHTECLYQYDHPVSPHLAAQLADRPPISDEALVNAIARSVRRAAAAGLQNAHLYVETAGGVHSPTLSGTTQAEAYRPLFLPAILIGDANLGGISTTIAAYEALLLRGYIVDAVLLFRDPYYRNHEYLTQYFAERDVWLASFEKPPHPLSSPDENFKSTDAYYNRLDSVLDTVNHLDSAHTSRLAELDSMPERAIDSVWWPFVQHADYQHPATVNVIDSASSDFFSVYDNKHPSPTASLLHPQLDSSASWWTQTFGHAHTNTTLAAARAAGRYGHVMFPAAIHLPALKLTEAMLRGPGKGWAHRVFISDNGSTGMEVAIKMALRAWTKRMGVPATTTEKLGVLGLTGSYHGDTIGAMDACEKTGVYTCEWHEGKGVWIDPPTVGFVDGKLGVRLSSGMGEGWYEFDSVNGVYGVQERMGTELEKVYREYVERVLRKQEAERKRANGPRLAALIIEPLVMGAGGMKFVDPLFQRVLVDVVRSGKEELGLCGIKGRGEGQEGWEGLPVIYDEVFVGLYRLGVQSAGPVLGVHPDIAVNAKVLTGGLVPLAVTLAKEGIFKAFLSCRKDEALLHGHSYSAHPVGCEVAAETLKEIGKLTRSGEWREARKRWGVVEGQVDGKESVWSFWDPEFVRRLSEMERVEEVMALGCVLAIKVTGARKGYTSYAAEKTFSLLNYLHVRKDVDQAPETGAPGGAPYSVHFRTLGNVAYFMTSLNTKPAMVRDIEVWIRYVLEWVTRVDREREREREREANWGRRRSFSAAVWEKA